MSAIVDRAEIESRIPHKGAMCLLSNVVTWDAENITCTANSHLDLSNPLRANNRLGSLCGIEYAAQAIAIHCALVQQTVQTNGYITAVREVQSFVARLDDVESPICISATQINAGRQGAMYAFELYLNSSFEKKILLQGRATLMFSSEGNQA